MRKLPPDPLGNNQQKEIFGCACVVNVGCGVSRPKEGQAMPSLHSSGLPTSALPRIMGQNKNQLDIQIFQLIAYRTVPRVS